MDTRRIDFADLAWESKQPGLRYKERRIGGHRIRLLEITSDYKDLHWCELQHTGYIVEGRISFIYDDETVEYQKGYGILISSQRHHRHKAIVPEGETAVLILFEPN